MNAPSFAIILAAETPYETLPAALVSLTAQHYPGMRLLTCGAGAEKTAALYNAGAPDFPATPVPYDPTASRAAHMNKAITMAGSDYLGFLPAEDSYGKDVLKAATDAIMRNPATEIISLNTPLARHHAAHLDKVLNQPHAVVLACFIKRTLFKEVGLFDDGAFGSSGWNAHEWMTRIALKGCQNTVIEETLYYPAPNREAEDCVKAAEEAVALANRLFERGDLTLEEVKATDRWQRLQLAEGFWHELCQVKLSRAEKLLGDGLVMGGAIFAFLCLKVGWKKWKKFRMKGS